MEHFKRPFFFFDKHYVRLGKGKVEENSVGVSEFGSTNAEGSWEFDESYRKKKRG